MDFKDILLIGFGIWLGVLSALFYIILAHYKRLVKGVSEGNLEKVLNKVLETETKNSKEISAIWGKVSELEKDGSFHIQRVGTVRYNPYNETGGAQSFSLALLDAHQSGFVITGLHARDRTRVYVKEIKTGKSTLELSKEELKAIKGAERI